MALLLSTTWALYCNVQETSYENGNLLNAILTLPKIVKPDSATTVATEFLEFHFPTKQNQCIMKKVLYEVRCLQSNEDMILALAGQFKQLSHEPEKFR